LDSAVASYNSRFKTVKLVSNSSVLLAHG